MQVTRTHSSRGFEALSYHEATTTARTIMEITFLDIAIDTKKNKVNLRCIPRKKENKDEHQMDPRWGRRPDREAIRRSRPISSPMILCHLLMLRSPL